METDSNAGIFRENFNLHDSEMYEGLKKPPQLTLSPPQRTKGHYNKTIVHENINNELLIT